MLVDPRFPELDPAFTVRGGVNLSFQEVQLNIFVRRTKTASVHHSKKAMKQPCVTCHMSRTTKPNRSSVLRDIYRRTLEFSMFRLFWTTSLGDLVLWRSAHGEMRVGVMCREA